MKSFVIAIKDLPESIQAAKKCIRSGNRHGIDIEYFDAITPKNTDVYARMHELGLPLYFKEIYSRKDNCIAAFLSHYSLWEQCKESGEEYQIFEHDAVIVNDIPETLNYLGCISLGKPSYGKFVTPSTIGVNTLTSKEYFPGAHAYRITPKGASLLVTESKNSACPTDLFLDIRRFPFLQEYYPWPVEVRESFTTIQSERGCYAKHGYNNEYKII